MPGVGLAISAVNLLAETFFFSLILDLIFFLCWLWYLKYFLGCKTASNGLNLECSGVFFLPELFGFRVHTQGVDFVVFFEPHDPAECLTSGSDLCDTACFAQTGFEVDFSFLSSLWPLAVWCVYLEVYQYDVNVLQVWLRNIWLGVFVLVGLWKF